MASLERGWLSNGFAPPEGVLAVDEASVPKPSPLPPPPALEPGPALTGIRSDAGLAAFLGASAGGAAVVEFGTQWCAKCHEMFPQFLALTRQYPQHAYGVAQVESMPAAAAGLRYTPTFGIFRGGRKVDEIVGKEPQRLADHLWLHAD